MVGLLGKGSDRSPLLSLVDVHDARTVTEAYIKRNTPAYGEDPLFIQAATASVPLIFRESLHELQDLIPPLFNVILSRLWAEIADEDPPSTFEEYWQANTALYTLCVLKSIKLVIYLPDSIG